MTILEHYHRAVNARTLVSQESTTHSETDILGAAGLASRHEPLGIALARMLSGGGHGDVEQNLEDSAFRRARTLQIKFTRYHAQDMAKKVLAWYRYGTCQPCQGTGYRIIPGTPSLGDECPQCRAVGKISLEAQFRDEYRELAKWLSAEIERSQAAAGTATMRFLAPRLNF